jgi:hypothetical protein
MVKCRVCGKKVTPRRIEEREKEGEEPTGMYYAKPKNLYGGRQSGEKIVQVKIYGCSDRKCIALEMTEKEYLDEKESQRLGF